MFSKNIFLSLNYYLDREFDRKYKPKLRRVYYVMQDEKKLQIFKISETSYFSIKRLRPVGLDEKSRFEFIFSAATCSELEILVFCIASIICDF